MNPSLAAHSCGGSPGFGREASPNSLLALGRERPREPRRPGYLAERGTSQSRYKEIFISMSDQAGRDRRPIAEVGALDARANQLSAIVSAKQEEGAVA